METDSALLRKGASLPGVTGSILLPEVGCCEEIGNVVVCCLFATLKQKCQWWRKGKKLKGGQRE